MAHEAALEVDQLQKTYRDGLLRRRRLEALRGVTFRVTRGEIFALLGPNGAGKTTMIKILLGISRASGGRARVLGHAAGARAARQHIGYLPEHLRVSGHHSALSAMSFYGRLSRMAPAEIRRRSRELLDTVGLGSRANDSVRKYSKGMLQRLGLAQALLHDPELLFLDEPTDGLDPVGRSQIRDILQQLKKAGKTIFLNSHLLQEVELVCDRVAILDRGVLRGVGTVDELGPRSSEGLELQLLVQATEIQLKTALQHDTIVSCQAAGDGQQNVTLRLADQAAVDQCVDQLRRQQVSIVSMSRRRVTLEDAFLHLLDDAEPLS